MNINIGGNNELRTTQ